MAPPTRGRGRGGGHLDKTASHAILPRPPESSARLDEDAETLIREAARFLDASDTVLCSALLDGDPRELRLAAEHTVTCHARVRRFVSAALHLDLEAVA